MFALTYNSGGRYLSFLYQINVVCDRVGLNTAGYRKIPQVTTGYRRIPLYQYISFHFKLIGLCLIEI